MKNLKIRFAIISLSFLILLCGCIANDIPYPRIQANFLTFNVKQQDKGSNIDSIKRTVTVYLPEEADIYNVEIESYTISPGANVEGTVLDSPLNLSRPVSVALHIYQDWTWTISAEQPIRRYFNVASQIGSSEIDVPGKRAIAYVGKSSPVSNVYVEGLKLGSSVATMEPSLEGKYVDFTHPVEVTVTEWGRSTVWTLFVEQSLSDVSTERVDAWTCVAWVYGNGTVGADNGVEYRLQGDNEWTRVPAKDLTIEGGSFMGRITHLSPSTSYEARAYSGSLYGATISFTTGEEPQVPNSSLDEWWLDSKIWCPWPENGTPWWDTGNKGAATLGQSNSVPTDDTSSGTGWAAKLETKFIGIGMIGKLAAGNLFAGSYVKTDGTNGILSFGRPFKMRPTRLRGYFKYTCAEINYASTEFTDIKGQPDTCIVWCALIDSQEPFEIRTNPKDRQLFDPDGPYVIAYGKMQMGESVPDYIPFQFDLEYNSTQRVPNYILITASASKYGDYFTGGTGSVLYIDDLKLEYDY